MSIAILSIMGMTVVEMFSLLIETVQLLSHVILHVVRVKKLQRFYLLCIILHFSVECARREEPKEAMLRKNFP